MASERSKEVSELYHRVLNLDELERNAVLEKADPELRQEVRAMLAQASSEDESTLRVASPGSSLGPYRIEESIGAGGMGIVFRATDTRLHRTVAIKVIPEGKFGDADAKRRFLVEARAASALNHPNIVTLHDIAHDGQVDFLVLEFVPGKTLLQSIPPGGMAISTAVEYAAQIASALAAAHAAGVVHRDLKPGNVMVTPASRIKVLDFGLAKLLDPKESNTSTETRTSQDLTQAGTVMGTAGYMSPEQVRGAAVDQRSDIFSFGCVLYEMVTGKAPFSRTTRMETLAAILRDEPATPVKDAKPLRTELQRLISQCLIKDPELRVITAEELESALNNFASGPAKSHGARSRRLSRRTVIAGGALLLVAGAGFTLWRPQGPRQVESLAVLPLTNATGNTDGDYLSAGIAESVINRLSQTSLKVLSRTTAFRIKERDIDPIALGKQLHVSAVMMGTLSLQGNKLVVQTELINTADGTQIWGEKFVRPAAEVQTFEEEIAGNIADALRLRLTKAEHTQLGKHDTANPEAYKLYLQGQFYFNKFSEEGFSKAIELYNGAIEKDPGYARAYAGVAHSYAVLAAETIRPPREVMPPAEKAATKAVSLDPALAEAHTALGIYHTFYTWDWNSARKELEEALALDPKNSDTLHFYGHYLQVMGRNDEAVAVMIKAQNVDPLSLPINAEYGNALYFARRFDEAAAVLKKTIELDHSFTFAGLSHAQALEMMGRNDEAVAELEVLKSQGLVWAQIELVCANARAGRSNEARRLLAEIEAGKQFADPYSLAAAYLELRDFETAFRLLQKAFEDRSPQIAFLRSEPKFDPIRSDSRYRELLRKLNLS